MHDIEELCPRVLLIDQGRLHYDGALAALAARVAPNKVINAVLTQPLPANLIVDECGAGVVLRPGTTPLQLQLSVPRTRVAETASFLLRLGIVSDLSIEEVPVDEMMRTMFRTHLGGAGCGGEPSNACTG